MTQGFKVIEGTEHAHPADHKDIGATDRGKSVSVTLILRRRAGKKPLEIEDFARSAARRHERITHDQFAGAYGAEPREIAAVQTWARSHGLEVVDTNPAARSVVVRGTVGAVNEAFGVELHDYKTPRETYHSHDGPATLPPEIAEYVEATSGLDNRTVPAVHYTTANVTASASDPPNTAPLTPQQVAALYDFPTGTGSGQTVGIYEMATSGGPPGYSLSDITATMKGYGLPAPQPIDVAVDGVTNSGVSDGETGLDITVAGAVAQGAKLAVYFTGGQTQNIIHALQRMIHPNTGDPEPTVISISYGWGPDDENAGSFSSQEYTQISALFQDAANLHITVLVSSGDSGAYIASTTAAQVSYPASDPWVTACGGTTVGNVNGANFDEYAWNDQGAGGPGASGGGVSGRFPVPVYQNGAGVPNQIVTNQPGRGVPDLAGNASENSGYVQYISGSPQPVGGTSAVAPLYAGLMAIVNANLGAPAGFLNPTIYGLAGSGFRDITSPPGPANNSYGSVTGYPVKTGWDACTGWGSVKGTALQTALKNA